MWVEFLHDIAPTSFMIDLINNEIPKVIQDRLDRCLYIHVTAGKFTEDNKLVEFVMQAVRYLFLTHWYVTSQRKEMLQSGDTEINLERLGYHHIVRRGDKDTYENGRVEIAHLVHHKEYGDCLAFDTTLFYDGLLREAERVHITLPEKDILVNHMIDAGIIIVGKDKKSAHQVKINGKNSRYYLISLDSIYPKFLPDEDVAHDIDNDIIDIEARAGNIVPFNSSKSSLEDLLCKM